MRKFRTPAIPLLFVTLSFAQVGIGPPPPVLQPPIGRGPGRATPPPIQPKPEELAKVKEKTEQIEALVRDLKTKRTNPDQLGDVEIYSKAGRMLLECPELFGTQNGIDHSFRVLDQGIERAKRLLDGQPPSSTDKKQIHAYVSEIDG